MKAFLSVNESLQLKEIDNVMRLRKNKSALFLLSVDTQNLANAFKNYLLTKKSTKLYVPEADNILHQLSFDPIDNFLIINRFNENNTTFIKNLQFGRDYIQEHKLKLIFIFDRQSLEKVKENAYDFFSTYSYSFSFSDHSYNYEAQKPQDNKLNALIKAYEEKPNLNDGIKAEMLFNIAIEAYSISNISQSLNYYEKALRIAKKLDNPQNVSAVLGNIGLIYQDKGDLDKALKYYKEALEIDKEIVYTQGVATNLGNIGNIYKNKGDLDKALKYQ
jgi:tetratricopeptide (TPR) repeat protein